MLESKTSDEYYYWAVNGGLTKDLDEVLEFTSQVKANNYLNNNKELDNYRDNYDISLF